LYFKADFLDSVVYCQNKLISNWRSTHRRIFPPRQCCASGNVNIKLA
jgi:hypothetical protein